MGEIAAEEKPTGIVIHMGTNSIEHDDFHIVEATFRKAISDMHWVSYDTKLIHRLDRPDLNYRMDFVNTFLQSLERNSHFHK